MAFSPQVSVVIATYNRADFLPQTIKSVFDQEFTDYELIVVDDGSTDGTGELLSAYEGQLKYVWQSNQGPSAARNLGVAQARAPWISIQDSDDLCAPNHLSSLYRFVQEHPDTAMVFGNGAYLAGSQHSRETIIAKDKSRRLASAGVSWADLFDKSIVRLQAALISKECYRAVGGHDEDLRIAMDLDLAFRLFAKFPVHFLDEVVFYYRKHEGNIGRNQELRLVENIRVIEKLRRHAPEAISVLGQSRVNQRLAYRYYRLAKDRRRRGDRTGARDALRQAVAHRPLWFKYRACELLW